MISPGPLGKNDYKSSSRASCAIDNLSKPGNDAGKPHARLWDHRFSAESLYLAQSPSPLKESAAMLDTSRMIPLGGGRPPPQYYPWKSMTLGARGIDEPSNTSGAGLFMTCTAGEAEFDLASVLDYGLSTGAPKLIHFFKEHVESFHNPRYQDWDVTLTCGSTVAIEIALRMLCNRGDSVLVEVSTYAGFTAAAKTQGLNVQSVEMDHDGIIPENLDAKLSSWDEFQRPKPSVLYLVPTGQNPTGITQSTGRKLALYEVAKKHDLFIIEDDPYYFMYLGEATKVSQGSCTTPLSPEDFKKRLATSYLSLDTDGRVLRMDSASKVLTPGLRLGWVTGSSQIIDMYVAISEVSSLSPSGPSQVMVYKLLKESWGHDGFTSWLIYLSSQYRQRRDDLLAACTRYLPAHICKWNTPKAGMFVWLRIDLSYHSSYQDSSPDKALKLHGEIEQRLYEKGQGNGVLVAKGSWFSLETETQAMFFRLTFASAPQSDLDQGVARFSEVLREEFQLEA
ncbi:hypothetical protein H9Q70_001258 [Fusarium xylarioides]|nr:hypothetical protein H9Q70_001258 [Fusarium xylarioides]KAG5785085.1 hypothetical protein H9Q73_001243 [Fusarium xylarioides]